MEKEEILDLFEEKSEGNISAIEKIYYAFLRRLKIRLNYKTWMLFDAASTLFMVFTYFLLSFIITPGDIAKAGYGESYFTFALVGIAISHYLTAALRSLSFTIRLEQFYGTIESVLSTPTNFMVIFLGDILYYFMYSTVLLLIILPLGVALGAKLVLNPLTVLTLIVLILLLIFSNLPIGIASAAVILKYKQGNPIGWALTWINQFFSGTFFPINLLPSYVILMSYALPLTYSLDAIRYTLIWGATLAHPRVLNDAIFMLAYAIVGLPIAVKFFQKIYDGARKKGSLGIY
ncbi:MAG: ABC transporter permease [Candidatus Njordarchaeia archaeon]